MIFPALRASYRSLLGILIGSWSCLCPLWMVGVIALVLVFRQSFENRSNTVSKHPFCTMIANGANWLIDFFRSSMLFSRYWLGNDSKESIFFQSWTFSCLHAAFLMNTAKVQTSKVSSHDLYRQAKMVYCSKPGKYNKPIANSKEKTSFIYLFANKWFAIDNLTSLLTWPKKETTEQGRKQLTKAGGSETATT